MKQTRSCFLFQAENVLQLGRIWGQKHFVLFVATAPLVNFVKYLIPFIDHWRQNHKKVLLFRIKQKIPQTFAWPHAFYFLLCLDRSSDAFFEDTNETQEGFLCVQHTRLLSAHSCAICPDREDLFLQNVEILQRSRWQLLVREKTFFSSSYLELVQSS